jgi:DNA repair protein SbcC/Rad50
MRLHHLSVTAFGPFVETVEVDFDILTEAGLFLLSGATGAGKSSVLDAVCFALYGAVPGERQGAGRLRSDQAPARLVPSVVLEASLSGRRFRIARSPAWDRPKKRGTGTTREQARVSVSERLGDEWTPLTSRLDEAGDLLSGLLGMNLDQFCQVAMLPQGHFQAFLRADSAQRHRLLARLFRTGRFEQVEAWLRDHRLELRRASERRRETVSGLVNRVSEAAVSALPECLADLPTAADDGTLLSWAVALRDGATARAAEAAHEVAVLTAAEEDARARLHEGRELATARARVGEAAATVERLEARSEEHAANLESLDRARRAAGLRPLLVLVSDRRTTLSRADERARASAAMAGAEAPGSTAWADELEAVAHRLAELRALLPAERRLIELRTEQARREQTLRSLAETDRLEQAEASAASARAEQVTVSLTEADAAAGALPALTARLAQLRSVVAAHEDLARLEAEHVLLVVDHSAAARRVLDARERLLELRERRIAGMAAELAGALAAGDDCPVCGSTDHPHPAVAGDGQPDAATERAAQRAVDDAQVTEAALAMRVRETTTAIERARQAVGGSALPEARAALEQTESAHASAVSAATRREELAATLADVRRRSEALAEAAARCQVRVAEETTAVAHLVREAGQLEGRVNEGRGSESVLNDVVERLEARRTLLRAAAADATSRQAAQQAHADAEVALGRAMLEAGFTTPDEASRAGLTDLDALEHAVRDHEAGLAAARALLSEPGAQELLAAQSPDLAALEREHRDRTEALERARARVQAEARLHARLVDLHAELAGELDSWAPLRAALDLASRVAAFAEGKAPDNRWRMRLSAYVLAYRLSQVVGAANARLAVMSDRRYSLEHVGNRGAGETRGGLSLVVRDDWSGESRDPATLSGGETFVVSLALALGLADVVAHEAGGTDLQTLFVDEGFGALDAETLDDVLDILDTLRENGRAVGVVSHVAEMRDRIPAQLVVTKARSGSTVRVTGCAG